MSTKKTPKTNTLKGTIKSRNISFRALSAEIERLQAKESKLTKAAKDLFSKDRPHPFTGITHKHTTWDTEFRQWLQKHRKSILKLRQTLQQLLNERYAFTTTRELHLAHCYLKGRTYRQCEQKCRNDPELLQILSYVNSGPRWGVRSVTDTEIKMWLSSGHITRFEIEQHAAEAAEAAEAEEKLLRAKAHAENARKNVEAQEKQVLDAQRRADEAAKALREAEGRADAARTASPLWGQQEAV